MIKRPAVREPYDELQHDPVSRPPDVSEMSREGAIEAIKDWFLVNFEDPVHSTPYMGGPRCGIHESRDGVSMLN
jgi:hypothetical protein